MTLCELITNPITRMVDEGKNLDEIAEAVCPTIQYGREKIIRVIKDFLGEEYLIQHAEVLGYDVGKAQLAKKRTQSSHKKIDATTDTVIESNSVTPPAACCQERVVKKKIVSENRDSEEETMLEEHDAEPVINVSHVLVEAIKNLIRLFSIEEVKKALEVAESEI